jgi:hypothetical protein
MDATGATRAAEANSAASVVIFFIKSPLELSHRFPCRKAMCKHIPR